MRLLTVRHVTTYSYSEPVQFGEHRMMFRPRASHDLRLLHSQLDIWPQPLELRWLHDVFDNSVAIATFVCGNGAAIRQHGDARAHRNTAARLRTRGRGQGFPVRVLRC